MKTKDSGIEWIGEIPEDWNLIKIGSVFQCRNEKVNDTDYPPLSVSKGGVVPQMESVAKTDANDNRKLVLKNDFVINSRSDRKQSCGLSVLDGSVSLINTVIYTIDEKIILPRYTDYLLKNYGFAEEFYRWGHGIVADLWTTRWQEMKNIVLPLSSVDEQQHIADYLDKKCAVVDRLMENQRMQIEKLKEYKQSVITEAVTKGIDKTVSIKYSENIYYPQIPSGWGIQKILSILSMPITDGPHTTPQLFEDGIAFVSAEAVSCGNGHIDFSHIRGYISVEFYNECCKKYVPQLDDIYMIKSGATTGKVCIVDTLNPTFTIWSPLAVLRSDKEKCYPKFLFYGLQSTNFQKQVAFNWSYGTQQNLGMRTLEQLLLPIPPISEQQQIAEYLDKKCAEIDKLISIKQQKIEKLTEYKKSLIYEYVTGKKQVG